MAHLEVLFVLCVLDPCSSRIFHSKTAPGQGTLKVFPDVLLSNAYIILRPFFRPLVPLDSEEILDAANWTFGERNNFSISPAYQEM
jgi:hypothetical protein